MNDATKVLTRHPANPLITVDQLPGHYAVFNPSPAQLEDETILLLSVTPFKTDRGGHTIIARSRDGVRFDIDHRPFIELPSASPYDVVNRHLIDSRVTRIEDTFYIVTPAMTADFDSPVGVLGRTRDFRRYEVMDIITQPRNRGASLFPEKIDGLYYKLDRPGGGDGQHICGTIWLSSSPDLLHWGSFRPVLAPNYSRWAWTKVGPTPPIRTPEGWLVIIHGVNYPCDGPHYYIGAILLDLVEPQLVIGRTYSFLLAAEEPYEQRGRVDNVVFPCGALADVEKDELRLYYGAADTCIALATGALSDVVRACQMEI